MANSKKVIDNHLISWYNEFVSYINFDLHGRPLKTEQSFDESNV